MNTAAWIAIAAIIVASINSWGQFLLKERSEKKKNLATANPATNQPPADTNGFSLSNVLRSVVEGWRKFWFIYLTQFVVNTVSILIGLLLYRREIPTNSTTVALLVYALIASLLMSILVWRAK
jgi:hypothetical protein